MNRKQGTAYGAALVAALGISYLPRQGAVQKPTSETGTPPQKRVATGTPKKETTAIKSAPEPLAGCRQIAKRLKRFYSADVPVPASCFPDSTLILNKASVGTFTTLHFVIALVPNPVQTHLPLSFDRNVEAIQQAAQDKNYTYDGSWFPWEQTEKRYELLSDRKKLMNQQISNKSNRGL